MRGNEEELGVLSMVMRLGEGRIVREVVRKAMKVGSRVMRLGEGRIVREVVRKAMKVGSRVKWVRDMMIGLEKFEWKGLDTQALSGLLMSKVKQVFKDNARRRVTEFGGRKLKGAQNWKC